MAMASIPPSYYHASAAIPTANHSDFFNTHEILQQPTELRGWLITNASGHRYIYQITLCQYYAGYLLKYRRSDCTIPRHWRYL